MLFDAAQGQTGVAGVVQRIPGFGQKVEPIIRDALVDASWPKFLHPFPLGDATNRGGKYFLVACKLTPASPWVLCVADVFDNIVPIRMVAGSALLHPFPFVKRPLPPLIPDRVQLDRQDATVSLSDIYAGPGLAGVPRGSVKQLRVFAYHYAYLGTGGHGAVGTDGGWDVKRILGTVPVHDDGSAYFRVPANTPLSLQPLDAQGRALQLMRSWFTAMPGEHVSCVGCHERRAETLPLRDTTALKGPPAPIAPWYGPARIQLRTRSPAAARQVLRGLPQRPTAARRPADDRPSRRATCRSGLPGSGSGNSPPRQLWLRSLASMASQSQHVL